MRFNSTIANIEIVNLFLPALLLLVVVAAGATLVIVILILVGVITFEVMLVAVDVVDLADDVALEEVARLVVVGVGITLTSNLVCPVAVTRGAYCKTCKPGI